MKIEQALATNVGGSILKKKVRKRSPKKNEKIEQALQTKTGGAMKFYDKTHQYLYENLSGKGARHDSPMCRKIIHKLTQNYHPSFFNSYMHGRVKDIPRHDAFHQSNAPAPRKRDATTHVVNYGGSMAGITHSENGMLRSHLGEWHPFVEIV